MNANNRVFLSGRLGNDPEVKHTDNGKVVANFTLATSEKYNNEEKTEWHNLVVWGKLAEIVDKYVKKGSEVSIWGKLQTRKWEKDGITRYFTEVLVNDLIMHGSKVSNQDQQAKPVSNNEDDGLPF